MKLLFGRINDKKGNEWDKDSRKESGNNNRKGGKGEAQPTWKEGGWEIQRRDIERL